MSELKQEIVAKVLVKEGANQVQAATEWTTVKQMAAELAQDPNENIVVDEVNKVITRTVQADYELPS